MPTRYRNDERDPTGPAAPRRAGSPGSSACDSCRRPLPRWTAALGATRCTACAADRPDHDRPGGGRPDHDREPVPLAEALVGAFEEVARTARAGRLLPAQRAAAGGGGASDSGGASGRDGTSGEGTSDGSPANAFAGCLRCGARARWHRTLRGRWVLLEPGDWPTGAVPVGKRWRITADGTAVALGVADPSGTCRISHFDACPEEPAPYDSSVLLGLWHQHAGRAGRLVP
ncbi:DUF6083 domain-containing protein [Kitasatospora sp. NPDC057015]|uniref:DUF6083 domain-containing protein n=1 Tax=Kitasatospora sp. NPDC057015 TaxID=3346001 RepID=UPI00362E280F